MKLLISQKDKIFDLIESAGLAPSQFEFIEGPSSNAQGQIKTILNFKNSDFYFVFENGVNTLDSHYAIFCPGKESFVKHEYPGGWEGQLGYVASWLASLLREIYSPNKWERLKHEIAGMKLSFENDQDKFSVSEFEGIQSNVLRIKQGLGSIGLQEEEIKIINQKLDHLTEMAKVLNKFDWKSLFVGSIASIVIQLSITPEHIKAIWDLMKISFSNFILP
jgi:hypothetical protein